MVCTNAYIAYGEDVPPTLVISKDYTAVLQTETYSGTVEAYDDSFADMKLGGLNNKAYCISLEGHAPVYLLLGSNGWNYLRMEIDERTVNTARYEKVG